MKKLMFILSMIILTGFSFGQTLRKGSILVFHSYDVILQPDATANQFLDFWQSRYIPLLQKAWPGLNVLVLEGNRGKDQFKYGDLWYFESVEVRNKLWPEEDETSPYQDAALEMLNPLTDEANRFVRSSKSGGFTDWMVLPINNPSDQNLEKGNLLGAHLLKVKLHPDVTTNQFLDALAKKVFPAIEENMEGWKTYLLKGDRGEHKDEYMLLYWIESMEARDRFYKEEGIFNESGQAVMDKIMSVMEEIQGLGTWTSEYTDWVIL